MKLALVGIWHRTLRLIGPVNVATGFITMGTVALAAWAMQLDSQGDALSHQLKARTASAPTPDQTVQARHVPVGQQIDEFVATFPPLSQNPADLIEVFQSAKRHDIQLPRGDYRFKNDVNIALVVLTATFPLSADYGSTKGFAADVLRALPHASIDDLRMTRSAADVGALESSIRFSFVYRQP